MSNCVFDLFFFGSMRLTLITAAGFSEKIKKVKVFLFLGEALYLQHGLIFDSQFMSPVHVLQVEKKNIWEDVLF
jgi:hypothetical protein